MVRLIRSAGGIAVRSPVIYRLWVRWMPNPIRLLGWKPFCRQLLVYQVPAGTLVLANDLNIAKTVLADRDATFPKSTHLQTMLRPLIGNGLFGQAGGSEVLHRRKSYLKILSRVPVARVAHVAESLSNRYLETWCRQGGTIPIPREMSRLTIDIVSSVIFGDFFTETESLRFVDMFLEYHKHCNPSVLFCTPADTVSKTHFIENSRLPELGYEMRKLIHKRFVAPLLATPNTSNLPPFVQALLDEASETSPENLGERLLDEIAVMILAGHETSASVLSWVLWEISGNPTLLDDVRSASPGSSEYSGALDALIQEGLRLYPPIAFYLRDLNQTIKFRGKILPKGSSIAISPWTIHRHEGIWQDATRFCPARWMQKKAPAENKKLRFQPFGYGARFCPGKTFAEAELRAILATILLRVDFKRVGTRDPVPLGNLTSRPDYDFHLTIIPVTPSTVTSQ